MSKNITLEIGNSIDPANSMSVEMDNQPKRLRDIELGDSVVVGPQGPAGPVGPKGEQGVSIVKIEKTAVNGNVDTYTITFSDGKTTTYEVKNGEVTLEELEKAVLNERIESEKRYAKAVDTEVITVEEFAQVELDEDGYMEDVVVEASKEITQEVREGKNLVDFSSDTKYPLVNDVLTIKSSNSYAHAEFDILDIIKNNIGKTLYFSCKAFDFSNSKKGNVQINYKLNDVQNYPNMLSNSGVFYSFEITEAMVDCTSALLCIYCNNAMSDGTTYTTTITEPMLSFENNLPYEAYGVSPSLNYPSEFQNMLKEVDFSNNQKNFFSANSSNVKFGSGGNATLERKINNNSLEIKCNGSWSRISCTIKGLKPNNNYTISCITKTDLSCRRGIYINDNYQDKAFTTSNDTRVVFKATTDSQGMINFYFYNNWSNESLNGTIIYDEIQITPGEVVLPYEPYQGNTSKLALPDEQFLGNFKEYSNAIDKGILKGQLKEIVLTGSESIDINTNFSFGNIFYIKPNNCFSTTSRENSNIICNYLKGITYNQLTTGIEGVTYNKDNDGKIMFFIEELKTATVEQFKAKLKELYDAGTPVKILYVAQTEEQQELSQENLQVVNSLQTYQGENNVSVPEAKLSFKANQGIPSYVEKVVDEKLVENNLSEREISDNKYARALKKEVSETDFTQVFAENEKIEGLQIYGEELTQDIREGYNLVDYSSITSGNGVKVIYSDDGYITMNGTQASSWMNFIFINITDLLEDGETYTLWAEKIDKSLYDNSFYPSIRRKDSDNKIIENIFISTSNRTFTVDKTSTYKYEFVIQLADKNLTLTNEKNRFMLYKGTDNKVYELPGAMPSLDFPSDVHTMNDRVNLFDKDSVTEGVFINPTTGVEMSNSVWIQSDFMAVEPNTIYTVSNTTAFSGNSYIQISAYNNLKEWIKSNQGGTTGNKSYTFTTDDTTYYIKLGYRNDKNLSNIKLAKGTQTSPYSPHGQGSLEVENVNENLYNVNDIGSINSHITIDKDGWITATGDNANGTGILWVNHFTAMYKKLKTSTNYNIILEVKSVSGNGFINPVSYVAGTAKSQFENTWNIPFSNLANNKIYVKTNKSLSDFSNSTYILRSFVSFGPGQSGSITFRLSVLEDTSITADTFKYVPHQSQATLIPFPQDTFTGAIGSYKDTIKEVDGRFKVEKWIKEIVLNGAENIASTTSREKTQVFEYWFGYINENYFNSKSKVLSNYFKYGLDGDVEKVASSSTSIYIAVNKETASTIEEFKAKLKELYNAGTPVKIYCVLTTPDYTDLPDETQEILNGIKLRLGLNNFSIDVGTFSMIYNKSLAKELEEKDALIEELASRILALENATLNLAEGE